MSAEDLMLVKCRCGNSHFVKPARVKRLRRLRNIDCEACAREKRRTRHLEVRDAVPVD